MNAFLENKYVKVCTVYIVPIIIGALFGYLPPFDLSDKSFWVKLVTVIGLSVWYIYASVQYDKINKKYQAVIQKLHDTVNELETCNEKYKKLVHAYDKEIRELTTLFFDSSASIRTVPDVILKGNTTLDSWNFKKVATGICNGIYSLLCDICAPYDDFTVNVMLVDVTATRGKRNITMIAHKGKYEDYPGKFGEKISYKNNQGFYAVKVCESGKSDIRILTTREEVNEKFVYIDESEHPEYSQYVGIPVYEGGNKMIFLLQICSFGSQKIAENKADIMDLVKKHILPFTHYALLAYGIERSLVAGFKTIDKLKGEKNGEK